MSKQSESKPSESKSNQPSRNSLPFEPGKGRKKEEKVAKKAPAQPVAKKADSSSASRPQSTTASSAIPEVVSRRMLRRMIVFCGLPSFLGLMAFPLSYVVVRTELFPLPTTAVLIVTLGFFGVGILGLSYGIFSTSWDEETPGSLIGFQEFQTNFGRMVAEWRAAKKSSVSKSSQSKSK
jgi:predicted RND superfamily exporter protein